MIEAHADEIARGLVEELQRDLRTKAYLSFPLSELQARAANVYRNLGRWLTVESESELEAMYTELGRQRFHEDIPASQVVYALTRTKNHLLAYVKNVALSDSALELYGELDLVYGVTRFYDKAIYYAVLGHDNARALGERGTPRESATARRG